MEFQDRAEVFRADFRKVGRVKRVVVDPKDKEVTHVVVRKGLLLATEKLVPVSLVAKATADRVEIKDGAVEFEDLPDFVKTHFVPAGTRQLSREGRGRGSAQVYYYPPAGLGGAYGGPYGFPLRSSFSGSGTCRRAPLPWSRGPR